MTVNPNLLALTTDINKAHFTALNNVTNRVVGEFEIGRGAISTWLSDDSREGMVNDIHSVLSRLEAEGINGRTAVRWEREYTVQENGEDVVKRDLVSTGIFYRGQDGSVKYLANASYEMDNGTVITDEEASGWSVRYYRVIRKGNMQQRNRVDTDTHYPSGMSYEQVLAEAKEFVSKRMANAKMATDTEYEIYCAGVLYAKGSHLNEVQVVEHTPVEGELGELLKASAIQSQRAEIMSIMNGQGIREFARDSSGKELTPTILEGLEADGVYARVKSLVVTYVKQFVAGQETTADYNLIWRYSHEPAGTLSNFGEEFFSVFIGDPIMAEMGDKVEAYERLLKWVKNAMRNSKWPYFIVGRKKRLIFSSKPFGETQITKDFQRVNVNRAEHLGQLVTARGIPCVGRIKTPEIATSLVADGMNLLLTTRQGEALGLTPGLHQDRMINPYGKGIICVMDEVVAPFLNEDSIKVKPDKDAEGNIMWPEYINGSDIIIIANSMESYNMKFSHQLGYVFIEKFLNAKGKIKPWGEWPQAMADNLTPERIATTLPTEFARLKSIGLPREHFQRPEGLTDVLVRAARPEYCQLSLFCCLPIERLDRNYFDKVGMYMNAAVDEGEEGRYMLRIPALAVNGAVQDLHYKDAKGNRILADKASPLTNTILAVIHEPIGEREMPNGDTKYIFPDDVEFGGDGRSGIIWDMLSSMGADSDGDRIARTYRETPWPMMLPVDRMLERAGLKCEINAMALKTKNPYPGINNWSEEHRSELWCQSTPLLRNVGVGDVMTQDCADLVFEGHMTWDVWWQQAKAGANIVQKGVSAPKYYMLIKYHPKMKSVVINAMVKDRNVGRGYQQQGLLFKPTIDKIEEHLVEHFPPAAEFRPLTVQHPARKWEGGMLNFMSKIARYDDQMGTPWVQYVAEAFKSELIRMAGHGFTDKGDIQQAQDKFKRNFRNGHARKLVRSYIAYFIQKYPEKANVWAWMLTPEFVRPQDNDRRPDGLPLVSPGMEDNMGQMLEVMGMPFDLEHLQERAAKIEANRVARNENRKNK